MHSFDKTTTISQEKENDKMLVLEISLYVGGGEGCSKIKDVSCSKLETGSEVSLKAALLWGLLAKAKICLEELKNSGLKILLKSSVILLEEKMVEQNLHDCA